MPEQFIVGFAESDLEDIHLTLVLAENAEHALEKYAKVIGIKEQRFLDYVYDRTFNLTLAQDLWLIADYEVEEYEATGRVLIDDTEFKQRVKDFFGENREYTERYLEYYYSNHQPGADEFPPDMLQYIWFEAEWAEVLVAPLAELPVLE